MDNFALEALVREIIPSLLQKQIHKIRPLGETGFALGLRSRTNEFLMISLERPCPTFFLTDRFSSSQREASDWLLTLRKYLMGGKILNVRKEFSERRVLVELENYRRMLSPVRLALVLELTPAKANAWLLNENQEVMASFYPAHPGKALGTLKTQTHSSWAVDRITKQDFELWALNSVILGGRTLNRHAAIPAASGEGTNSMTAALRSRPAQPPASLSGMSRYFVQEIFFDRLSDPESLWERFQTLLKRVQHGPYLPQLYFLEGRHRSSTKSTHLSEGFTLGGGGQIYVSPFPLDCLGGLDHSEFQSINAAVAEVYRICASNAFVVATRNSQLSQVDSLLKKRRRLLMNLREDLGRSEEAETYKKYADLLYAQQHKSPPGGKGVKLVDLFDADQKEIEVPLDPELSLIQNAVRYSKLYQKARRSIPLVASRIKKTEQEIRVLAHERERLAAAVTLEGLRQAGSASLGSHAGQGGSNRPDKTGPSPTGQGTPRHPRDVHDALVRKTAKSFLSSDGLTILVGKSSKDNDTLTLKIAQSDDFWFHVAGYGGSHVVLRNPQKLKAPPRLSLLEAAGLAAYFSQARNSSKVEVHYTQKKSVSKPKGSKPGLVQLRDYKSVSVKPDLPSPQPG
jgi:predicted ribosome quality control (RQC) complex YloA/Tae2 family protein